MPCQRKPLRLAFIGGGQTSAVGYVHFCASQMDNKFIVVAGAFCRSQTDNIQTGAQWGIDANRCYSDWKELIRKERESVDAIVVLTPTPHHLEVLIALLKENIPVICEKSLVMGPKEVSELKKHYDKNKHFLAVTFNYTGYPMIRSLRQMISEGKLGRIQKIHLEMPQEGFRRPPDIAGKSSPPQAWRLQDGEIPTVCLDLGVHLHHMVRYIFQKKASRVIGDFRNHSHYEGIIDDVNLLVDYGESVTGHMWFSKTAIGNRNGMKVRVFGDQASVEWYQLNPDEMLVNKSDGTRQILDRGNQGYLFNELRYNRMKPGHPAGFIEAFSNIYADFADNLQRYLDGERDVCGEYSAEIAYEGLDFFSAAKLSFDDSCWVSI